MTLISTAKKWLGGDGRDKPLSPPLTTQLFSELSLKDQGVTEQKFLDICIEIINRGGSNEETVLSGIQRKFRIPQLEFENIRPRLRQFITQMIKSLRAAEQADDQELTAAAVEIQRTNLRRSVLDLLKQSTLFNRFRSMGGSLGQWALAMRRRIKEFARDDDTGEDLSLAYEQTGKLLEELAAARSQIFQRIMFFFDTDLADKLNIRSLGVDTFEKEDPPRAQLKYEPAGTEGVSDDVVERIKKYLNQQFPSLDFKVSKGEKGSPTTGNALAKKDPSTINITLESSYRASQPVGER